ncbi:MAG: hypothetical protein RBR87_12855 [Bacteroidales bacterium]|jgi:hypothetical protein|nr:hypothetical protein [Bacteroidales bacterium]
MKNIKMMKKIMNLTKLTLILTLFMGWSLVAMAQAPPPPPPGGHGQGGNQPAGSGGGAPIGGGLVILLSLGAAYGGRKAYQAFKKEE